MQHDAQVLAAAMKLVATGGWVMVWAKERVSHALLSLAFLGEPKWVLWRGGWGWWCRQALWAGP